MSGRQLDPEKARTMLHAAARTYEARPDGFDGVRAAHVRRVRTRRASAVGAGAIALSALGLGVAQLVGAPGSRGHVVVPAGNPSASAPAPTTPTTAVAAETVPAGVAAGCRTSDLRVTLEPAGNSAGTFYERIVFLNAGSRACTLRGYPGVSFADSSGRQLGNPAGEGPIAGAQVVTVVLQPGRSGGAFLALPDTANFPPSMCGAATSTDLRVYPPDNTVSVLIPFTTTICTTAQGRTTVAPVQSGQGS